MPWWNYWGQIGPQFYQIIPKWIHFLHILSLRVSKVWIALTSSEDRNSDLWTLIWQKVRRFLQLNARDSGARLTGLRSFKFPSYFVSGETQQNGTERAVWHRWKHHAIVCGLFNWVTWKVSQSPCQAYWVKILGLIVECACSAIVIHTKVWTMTLQGTKS